MPLRLENTLLISAKDTGRERFVEPHPGAAGTDKAITDPFSPDPLRNRTSVLFLPNLINTEERNFLFGGRTATTLPGSSECWSSTDTHPKWLPDLRTPPVSFQNSKRNTLFSLLVQTKEHTNFYWLSAKRQSVNTAAIKAIYSIDNIY